MNNLKISKTIEPYFNYYLRKYPIEIFANCLMCDIPIKDGCASLDAYFINVLKNNGFSYREDNNFRTITMIKAL